MFKMDPHPLYVSCNKSIYPFLCYNIYKHGSTIIMFKINPQHLYVTCNNSIYPFLCYNIYKHGSTIVMFKINPQHLYVTCNNSIYLSVNDLQAPGYHGNQDTSARSDKLYDLKVCRENLPTYLILSNRHILL